MLKKFISVGALFVVCLLMTWRTALPTDTRANDAWTYAYASRTLRNGYDLRQVLPDGSDTLDTSQAFQRHYYTTFPPGMPVTLALFEDVERGAALVNAVSLWLTLLLAWSWLRAIPAPARVGLLVGYATHLLYAYSMVWSEPPFTALFIAWLLAAEHIDRRGALAGMTLTAAGMGFYRYIGMPFALLGAVWVWYRRGAVAAGVYLMLPGAVFGGWLMRNYLLTGALTGHQAQARQTLEHALTVMTGTLTGWAWTVILWGGLVWAIVVLLRWWWSATQRLFSSPRRPRASMTPTFD